MEDLSIIELKKKILSLAFVGKETVNINFLGDDMEYHIGIGNIVAYNNSDFVKIQFPRDKTKTLLSLGQIIDVSIKKEK